MFLLLQKSPGALGKLTPIEERVLFGFGENMLYILKNTLKHWAHAMWEKIRVDPSFRPIREREHVDLIMLHLREFQKSYEERYGKMESGKPSSVFGEVKDNTVFIKSTGYGVKVVLGLLMADRMHVVERKRKLERETVGFIELKADEVAHDAKNCPICQEPMGVENLEGTKEAPLRLVICCGQVIGSGCMRAWLGELVYESVYRDTCPVCRFKFPDSFMELLFSKDEYTARILNDRPEVNLVSPSPGPAETRGDQQEQDAELQRDGELSEEGEFMDVDPNSDLELLSPSPLGGVRRVIRQTALGFVEDFGFNQVEPGELAENQVLEDHFEMEG